MKRIALILAVIMAGMVAGCADKSAGDVDGDTKDMPALAIRDIQNDPLAFTGKLKINGVASAFSEDDATFFWVMDTAELFACKNLYCGAYAMPAKYAGKEPLPELADLVDIIGSFVQTGDGYYFEVSSFEVKQNIMEILVFSNQGGA